MSSLRVAAAAPALRGVNAQGSTTSRTRSASTLVASARRKASKLKKLAVAPVTLAAVAGLTGSGAAAQAEEALADAPLADAPLADSLLPDASLPDASLPEAPLALSELDADDNSIIESLKEAVADMGSFAESVKEAASDLAAAALPKQPAVDVVAAPAAAAQSADPAASADSLLAATTAAATNAASDVVTAASSLAGSVTGSGTAAATAVKDLVIAASAAPAAASSSLSPAASAAGQAAAAAATVAAAAQSAASNNDVAATVQAGLETVQKTLAANGVDKESLAATASTASSLASQAWTFLTNSDPVRLAEDALGIVALFYLLPPLAKAGFAALRGYAGEVLPTTALDMLVSQGNNALVDIRPLKDKEQSGVPDLADVGKLIELEFVAVADSKLYGRMRNAADVEVESTAIQIASLKKLNKGMTLYMLDTNGVVARGVAKELCKRGFGKVFVISGGCKAWTAAKLRTKPYNTPQALLPTTKVEVMG